MNTTTTTDDALLKLARKIQFGDERMPERFWSKIKVSVDGCWEWVAGLNRNGYGQYYDGDRTRLAHRVCYLTLVGPIEHGLECDHLCRNRHCVNPAHIEPVSTHINRARGEMDQRYRAFVDSRTHCKRGHEFTPENTYVDKRGFRSCVTCKNQIRVSYRPSSKWRLIDCAPNDGSTVLVGQLNGIIGFVRGFGKYVDGRWQCQTFLEGEKAIEQPTHWMPIPPPPPSERGKKDKEADFAHLKETHSHDQ